VGSITWWRVRIIPVLILAGMALFLNDQGARREPGAQVRAGSVVEGTAAGYRAFTDSAGSGNRTSTRVVFALTLAEYPANVTFRLDRPPTGGVPDGARVRLDVAADADESVARARRHPDTAYVIRALGAVVDGRTVYTAAEGADRATAAVGGYRIAAGGCALLALAWLAWLVRTWSRRTG
jgi:hypothetical protein